MDIIFMGTPSFSVPSLKLLLDSDDKIVAVFTQPDKPVGRGYKVVPTKVKELALTYGVDVFQPTSLKKGEEAEECLNKIRSLAPDLIVVVAYGKILPKQLLDIPKFGCINVHASLLPKYRGAGPIQWSVLNGEKETGVTTMQMADGIDTGDMLLSKITNIGEDETASELHDRLSVIGAEVLADTIKSLKTGTLTPVKQDDSLSSHAPMLTKDPNLCNINFNKTAQEIHNQIRGLSEWPCSLINLNGKRIKIYKSHIFEGMFATSKSGEIVNAETFTVACGDKRAITIVELQEDGGKRLKTSDYLRGNKIKMGSIL